MTIEEEFYKTFGIKGEVNYTCPVDCGIESPQMRFRCPDCEMNNTKNVDRVTGKQYTVKNIIVYDVVYTNYCEGTYCKYNKIDNIGSGTGYYITNGYAVPIKWTKKDAKSQTVYTYLNGEEIEVSDGNTYIQIYPRDEKLTIS